MPGVGKTSCVEYLLSKYPDLPPILYFGGITMDEVARRGLAVNEANEKTVREGIRAQEGMDAYAKRMAVKIDDYLAKGRQRILLDGLYSWSEYKFLKEKYGDKIIVVAISAPRKLRHARLHHRPVRPLNPEQASQRDYSEIEGIEKGGPIANADFTLVNSSQTTDLFRQLDALLVEIGF